MKRLLLLALIIMIAPTLTPAENTPVVPNAIALNPAYMSRKGIAPTCREDKGHIRTVTGNKIVVAALRVARKPLPDGSVPGK